MKNCEQSMCASVQEKLSGYLDNELTQQEQQRIYIHLQKCPQCEALLDDFRSMRGDVKAAVMIPVDNAELTNVFTDKPARWLSMVGWILFIGSVVLVTGFVTWEWGRAFFTDDTAPWWFKIGIIGIYLGLLSLFLSVLRQRLIARKTDKYKKVNI